MTDPDLLRAQVRAWIDAHFDPGMALRSWLEVLADSGWAAPAWGRCSSRRRSSRTAATS